MAALSGERWVAPGEEATPMRWEAAPAVADDLDWSPVSAEQPCPVCGQPTCKTAPFQGGLAVDCLNVVSAWPMVDGGWLHLLPPRAPPDDRRDRTPGATCAFPMPAAGAEGARGGSGADGAGQLPAVPTRETVLGAFGTRELAEGAIDALVATGFHADRLSALGRHGGRVDPTPGHEPAGTRALAARIGAAVRGVGAAALDFVAATIPGVGPGVALGHGFAGGLAGFLTSHGVPEHEAARYAERVRAGAYVVAVHTDDGPRAEAILARSGAAAPIRHVPD
jgi:hypothetical protein